MCNTSPWAVSPGLLCSRLSLACSSCRKTTASRTTSTSSTSKTRPVIRRRSHSLRLLERKSTTPSEKLSAIPRSCWPSRCTSSPPPVLEGYVPTEARIYHLRVASCFLGAATSQLNPSLAGSLHAEHQFKRRRPSVPAGLLPGCQRAVSLTALE